MQDSHFFLSPFHNVIHSTTGVQSKTADTDGGDSFPMEYRILAPLCVLIMICGVWRLTEPIRCDTRFTDNQVVGATYINRGGSQLPADADVLLQPMELEFGKSYSKWRVGVRPKGFATAWIGELELEDDQTYYGIQPRFADAGQNACPTGLSWVANNLLLVTAVDFPQGSGGYQSRFDSLFLFADGAVSQLLSDELRLYGRGGWTSHFQGSREIALRGDSKKLAITFTDDYDQKSVVETEAPLF